MKREKQISPAVAGMSGIDSAEQDEKDMVRVRSVSTHRWHRAGKMPAARFEAVNAFILADLAGGSAALG